MCRPDNMSQDDKQAYRTKGMGFSTRGFHNAMLQVNWGWSASCCSQLAQGMASRGALLYSRP